MDNYIKVYTNEKNENFFNTACVISAGRSEITDVNHYVKRKYENNNYLIVYLLKGKMYVFDDDYSYSVLSEGNIVIFAPNTIQNYYFTNSPATKNYWVHFIGNAKTLKDLNLATDNKSVFDIGVNDKIATLWEDLITEIQLSNFASDIMANAKFMQILTSISRAVYKTENPKNSFVFKQLTPAIINMYKDYAENKPNHYYADLCNMSESSFYHLFAKTFNTTPNKYLNEIRIRNAVNLLQETDYSLDKIAFLTGYSTPQYFSKKFKEKFGVSPYVFRNQTRL